MARDEVLAIALAGMQQDQARLERVALNVANATTPAYRRQIVALRAFGAEVDALQASGAPSALGGAAATLQVLEDARAGAVRLTVAAHAG